MQVIVLYNLEKKLTSKYVITLVFAFAEKGNTTVVKLEKFFLMNILA